MTLRPPDESSPTPVAKRRSLAGLKLTATDDPRKRKTYQALRESIRASGINNVPIFHDVDDFVWDGNGRLCAMVDEALTECLAIQLPADWTKADILKFSIATDGIRRVLPLEELAEKAEEWIELTGSTQDAAARELGISPGYLSKALALLLMPEKYREKAKSLSGSVKTAIASETDSARQERLLTFATTPGPDGKLPTRDSVIEFKKQLHAQDKPKAGRKPSGFEVEDDDIRISIRAKE